MRGYESLSFLDATALAQLVRNKEVQPSELVELVIEWIEQLNPQLNAVITPMYDEARKAAQSAIPDGLFTGVPYLIQDLLAAYKGVPMCFGTRILEIMSRIMTVNHYPL